MILSRPVFENSCNRLHDFCFCSGFSTASEKLLRAQFVPADQDVTAQFTQWIDLSNRVLLDQILN